MGHFLALNFSCWLCCFSGGYAACRDPQVAPFCGGARTWYRRQPDNRQPPSSNPPPALSIPLFQLGTTLTGYFHIEMWQPRTIYFLESNIARLLCKVIFKIPRLQYGYKMSWEFISGSAFGLLELKQLVQDLWGTRFNENYKIAYITTKSKTKRYLWILNFLFDEKCKEMWTTADKYVHGAGSLTWRCN